MKLDNRELAAVLAGLRLLQQADGIGELAEYSNAIADIAADAGDVLSDAEIDAFCERLNVQPKVDRLADECHGYDLEGRPLPTNPVRRYLDCSDYHLPKDFRENLWHGLADLTVIAEGEHRIFIYVDEETLSPERLAEMPLPEPVQNIVRHALDYGCEIICFDPDGYRLNGFEVFDEDEE